MSYHIVVVAAFCLVLSSLPTAAQTGASFTPREQTSALPPAGVSSQPAPDPNAPRWMLLEGYEGGGHVGYHWELVRPQDFDVTNYHGFHTSTN